MKKIRCKYCKHKLDMNQLEGDWKFKFYQCPKCHREIPKRTILGKAVRVAKFAWTPIIIFWNGDSSE